MRSLVYLAIAAGATKPWLISCVQILSQPKNPVCHALVQIVMSVFAALVSHVETCIVVRIAWGWFCVSCIATGLIPDNSHSDVDFAMICKKCHREQRVVEQEPEAEPTAASAGGVCARCGVGSTKVCAGCFELWYCSRKCQKQSWSCHRLECIHPTIHVYMMSGKRKDYSELQLKRSVADLKKLIMQDLPGISDVTLLVESVVLNTWLSLHEAGLYDGVAVAVLTHAENVGSDDSDDSMPDLVGSDDSSLD